MEGTLGEPSWTEVLHGWKFRWLLMEGTVEEPSWMEVPDGALPRLAALLQRGSITEVLFLGPRILVRCACCRPREVTKELLSDVR